jgi:hypothetical protein
MATQEVRLSGLDPRADEAATLLAGALLRAYGDERELLWHLFRDRVAAEVKELEEAPVREALDDLERRGLNLAVVARILDQRLEE